ncbi:MAG TPA: flagellar protein FlaG [Candidatus Gastranaerophilales bacterium]|nr:flagellar protein FlaG [Candidatus Gastranaerophilales bacterium]
MPIDGVSSQNLGFQQVNPTEVNIQAEAASKAEAQKMIKEANKSAKTKADGENDDDQERDLEGRDSDESDSEEEDDSEKTQKFLQNTKKFNVKFNSSTEMVEMIDISTGNIVESVSPEDLINLLSKTKAFSGILVDRKI